MNEQKMQKILSCLGIEEQLTAVTPFHAEEDGKRYSVWRLDFAIGQKVLKKTTRQERSVYETFLSGFAAVPRCYGFWDNGEDVYMLMEYFDGQTLSCCTREKLKLALDALIELQNAWWQDTAHATVGLSFEESYPRRRKWLPHLADLAPAFEMYLESFRSVPRTLCNDDMLPFNVLADQNRAVILDWEYAGILPYPCALARLIAYGEEREDALFFMTEGDKAFALQYYYDRLVRHKRIGWEEYLRTMELFLLKEYAEWVYCAHSSGDLQIPYYRPYYERARRLADKLMGESR